MTNPAVQTLIFDLGNVLFDIDIPRGFQQIQDLLKNEMNTTDWKEDFTSIIQRYETGKITTEMFVALVLDHCHDHVQTHDVIRAWNSILIGMPASSMDLLQTLAQKYPMFLLSNINELHYDRFLEMLPLGYELQDFEHLFEHCYYSHILGKRKPDVAAFKHILTTHQLDPSTTLFMDDMVENIISAQSLGIQTLLIQPGHTEIQIKNYLWGLS